jgi:hypothetical protein
MISGQSSLSASRPRCCGRLGRVTHFEPPQALQAQAVPAAGVDQHHQDVLTGAAAKDSTRGLGVHVEVLRAHCRDRSARAAGAAGGCQLLHEYLSQEARGRVAVQSQLGLVHRL